MRADTGEAEFVEEAGESGVARQCFEAEGMQVEDADPRPGAGRFVNVGGLACDVESVPGAIHAAFIPCAEPVALLCEDDDRKKSRSGMITFVRAADREPSILADARLVAGSGR